MINGLKQLIVRELRAIADKIDRGLCELTALQAEDIISVISHLPLSKTEAYIYLGIGRSLFDSLVRLGDLPKGRKRMGFKELVWYKDELNKYKLK